jgi:hypothetical protein
VITNLRERIKQAMTTHNCGKGCIENVREPSPVVVDRVEKLFREMLAEEKVGNGS